MSAIEEIAQRTGCSQTTIRRVLRGGNKEVWSGTVERAEKIRQVLLNLSRNAMQAMPEGGHLRVTSLREPDRLILSVEDTGSGIPSEELGRIFDPFFTTKENGTGLGLAIVKKIVEFHGGNIRAESEPGKGTRFTIHLPQTGTWQES